MTWQVFQIRETSARAFGLSLVRADDEAGAIDKVYSAIYAEAKRLGLRAPAKSLYKAVPTTNSGGTE